MATRKKKKKDSEEAELAIVGELFDETESEIVKDLLDIPPGDPVTIYIDSTGGNVYAALTIAGIIRLRNLQATAIVLAECSSSAILIFAACKVRKVSPRSVFLFHRIRWRSEKDVRCEEAANWAGHFKWLEKEVDEYQASLFGLPHDRFAEWERDGRFVLGPELVELGVAELIEV